MDTAALVSLGGQWRRAAQELGIEFEVPYTLVALDGARFDFACLLPQFGAERGMLLGTIYNEVAANAATKAGFGFSYMDADDPGVPFDLSGYIDCLKDWGWAALREEPPPWYTPGG